MPGGCFEQTSSSTYPNVLAPDYMKRTKKLAPEVHAKAEGYIANGYQRLLTPPPVRALSAARVRSPRFHWYESGWSRQKTPSRCKTRIRKDNRARTLPE